MAKKEKVRVAVDWIVDGEVQQSAINEGESAVTFTFKPKPGGDDRKDAIVNVVGNFNGFTHMCFSESVVKAFLKMLEGQPFEYKTDMYVMFKDEIAEEFEKCDKAMRLANKAELVKDLKSVGIDDAVIEEAIEHIDKLASEKDLSDEECQDELVRLAAELTGKVFNK